MANDWTPEEIEIARNAVERYRRKRAAKQAHAAALDRHLSLAVGDTITFCDTWGRLRTGTVTRRGTVAGWADVDGTEIRFEALNVI